MASLRRRRSPSQHRRAGRLLFAVAAMLLVHGTALAAHVTHDADRVKAAFLVNFTKFIHWPPGRLGVEDAPIVLATHCPPEFTATLEEVVGDRKVLGHPIEVRPVRSGGQARAAHLLFVCADDERTAAALMDAVQEHPVVTVGETPAFAARGGMITFAADGDRLRFDINAEAARRAGLRMSAQLQKLARTVR